MSICLVTVCSITLVVVLLEHPGETLVLVVRVLVASMKDLSKVSQSLLFGRYLKKPVDRKGI
jgi:hypothetical protein